MQVNDQQAQSKFHLISVDEKTGIQALNRLEGRAPESRKLTKRREFEYERNGTTTLMAALDVGTNQVIHHWLNPTRTEADFLYFTQQTCQALPANEPVIFLADQLNTHLSESLVRWVAQQENDAQPLGIKGESGILKSQETRRTYLQSDHHRIRFVYTPKHCSWLNPVENWFAKLQRHVITYGNFPSVEDLNQKIEAYIPYYNQALCKKLRWTFRGFEKDKELVSINWVKT